MLISIGNDYKNDGARRLLTSRYDVWQTNNYLDSVRHPLLTDSADTETQDPNREGFGRPTAHKGWEIP